MARVLVGTPTDPPHPDTMPGSGILILLTNILVLALVFDGLPMAVLWVGARVVRRASRGASSEEEAERLSRRVWELERRLADADDPTAPDRPRRSNFEGSVGT